MSIFKVKRSSSSGAPSALAQGEMAYSYLAGSEVNGGDRLYMGTGTETAGEAANIDVIGGKYFTSKLDHTPGTVVANSAIITDASGQIDTLSITGNITVGGTVDGRDVAADGTKLDTIASGAEVNVDTNLGTTANTTTRTITSSTGTNVVLPAANSTQAGMLSSADKAAIDAIVGTDLSTSANTTTRTVASSTGTDAILVAANSTQAGVMSSADKSKLDGIEAAADVTDATNVAASGAVMDSDFSSNGLMKRTGAGTYTSVTAPSGTVVGTTDTQTLTNKTLTTPTLTLKQSTAPTPTAEGDIQWDTDDNKIKIGDGSSTKTFSDDSFNAATYQPLSAILTNTTASFTTADETKLDGIEAGAQVNVATNLGTSANTTTRTVTSSTGSNVVLPAANSTQAGVMLSTDKSKLDGIESGATADQSAAEILTAIKTVDGSGSGLDADLWDGNQFASYLNQAVLSTSSPTFANGHFTNNLTVDGDLVVNGNTFTVNVTTLQVEDALIRLAANNTTTDAIDIGFIGSYYDGADQQYAGLFRDATNGNFYLFNEYVDAALTDNVIDRANGTFVLGTLNAGTFVGALTGNASTATALQTARTIQVSGDVAGSASFDGTGNINISTTIQSNSVALGTDTTGNYVATISATGGTGISVSGSGSETAAITIAGINANNTVKGVASFDSTNFTVSSGAVSVNTIDGGTY